MSLRSRNGIAYEEQGSGIPFIAIHGYSLDRRMSIGAFEPLLEARHYRRIYLDLPFMGESTDDIPGSGHDGILAALSEFVSKVVPEGSFLLAGESYGGYLARGLTREFAERVAGIFLLCPAIVPLQKNRNLPAKVVIHEEEGWRGAASATGATKKDIAEYETLAIVKSAAAFRRTKAEVIARIRVARIRVARIRVARLPAFQRYLCGQAAFSFDYLGKAGTADEAFDPSFDRPVSFVLGRQDTSVGWRDALRLAERYPRASFHIVDAAGHNLQIEKPNVFAAAFLAWLDECVALQPSISPK